MNFTVKTLQFQNMVARASKGASEDKILPITSMMGIELKENKLTLTTTDTANTLQIMADKIEGEEGYAVVPVDVFSKLIARMTTETITMKLKGNSLEVTGNGVYNIALPVDESGSIRIPEFKFKKVGDPIILNLTTVKNILSINKAALAKNLETPYLCGYYLGERVVTTDENVICFNEINVLGIDVLISPEMMELLALHVDEKIKCYYDNKNFLFESSDMILCGAEHDGKELYPVDDIKAYLDENFTASCKIPKLLLQNVMDRLALFIEPYDKNGAYFTFTPKGLSIQSKQSSGVEVVGYTDSKDFIPFRCCVDIPLFKAQIDANPSEVIELWYGHEAAIKITSGNIIQVIALLEDEAMNKMETPIGD